MMLSQEQIKQFDELGFLKGDVVLSDEEVEQLREELENVMEGKSVKSQFSTATCSIIPIMG